MTLYRFNANFSLEGSIEVELPENATDNQINKAIRKAVYEEFRKSRGLPYDINIGHVDGPY